MTGKRDKRARHPRTSESGGLGLADFTFLQRDVYAPGRPPDEHIDRYELTTEPSGVSGPRTRRVKRTDARGGGGTPEEKRPRTAFSGEQLARLKREFAEQNKRAKIKKASGQKNPLALQLMAQGLYNHSTVPLTKEEEEQAAELQAK